MTYPFWGEALVRVFQACHNVGVKRPIDPALLLRLRAALGLAHADYFSELSDIVLQAMREDMSASDAAALDAASQDVEIAAELLGPDAPVSEIYARAQMVARRRS